MEGSSLFHACISLTLVVDGRPIDSPCLYICTLLDGGAQKKLGDRMLISAWGPWLAGGSS